MSRLRDLRKQSGKKLRNIAEILDVTPQTVQQQEIRGIRTVRTAKKYANAFPNCDWKDLIEN